ADPELQRPYRLPGRHRPAAYSRRRCRQGARRRPDGVISENSDCHPAKRERGPPARASPLRRARTGATLTLRQPGPSVRPSSGARAGRRCTMWQPPAAGGALAVIVIATLGWWAQPLQAQGADPNAAPNPYREDVGWAKLPEGRKWGAAIGVDIDRDGKSIWVFDRCATANDCS